MKYLKYVGFGILGLGFIAGAVWLTMSLWNTLVPELFNGPVINYWQTAGLFLLSKILFAGVSPKHHHNQKPDHAWKKKFIEKCREQKTEEV